MSKKSPVSTICFEAWAKRASSRSIGGIEKKPGRKQASETSTSRLTTVERPDATASRKRAGVRRPDGAAARTLAAAAASVAQDLGQELLGAVAARRAEEIGLGGVLDDLAA